MLHPFLLPFVGWSFGVALAQSWQYPLHGWGLVAAMSGIYTAYAWDRLIDARRDGTAVPLARIIYLGVGGGLLTLAVFSHPSLLPVVLVLAGLGIFYIPLKQFIPKNLLTALAWTLVVVILPFDVLPFSWKILLGAVAVFLTIYGAATLCDIPDIAEDTRAGVRGLATHFGGQSAARIAGGLAAIGALVAVQSGVWRVAIPAIMVAALGFGAIEWLTHNKASQFWVDALLILPGIFVLIH